MKARSIIILLVFVLVQSFSTKSQNVAISDDPSYTAHSSAMLDVKSLSKGLLIPRLTALERSNISGPANGLLVYQTDGSAGFWYFNGSVWIQLSTNTGTVTSVGLAMPVEFTISNSPVTTSGTLTASWSTQNPNTIFAGPASGGAATPTFRSMVAADLPSGSTNYIQNQNASDQTADFRISGNGIFNGGKIGITNLSPIAKIDIQSDGLGATLNDVSGLFLRNTIAAAAGAQQYSPALTFEGFGWATTPLNSQNTKFALYMTPVQGAANPTTNLIFASSINNAAYATRMTLTSAGTLTLTGDINVSGNDMYCSNGVVRVAGEDDLYIIADYNSNDADIRNIIFGKNSQTAPTELMRIQENGFVGIGTTPSTQFHTTGGVRFQTLTGTGTRFVLTDDNGNLSAGSGTSSGIVTGSGTLNYVPKWTPDGATLGNSLIFDNGTQVGVGTIVPEAKLEVKGDSPGDCNVLFQVKDDQGNPVFVVYPKGVKIYIDKASPCDDTKAGETTEVSGFRIGKKTSTGTKEFNLGEEYLTVSASNYADTASSQARILWYPEKEAFMAGRILVSDTNNVGLNSWASGFESQAKGNFSQALGWKSKSTGNYSTAIGRGSEAIGESSFAIGYEAIADSAESFAVGMGAHAQGRWAVAMGHYTWAMGSTSTATGWQTHAIGNWSTAMGLQTVASGSSSTAIGSESVANGYISTASGDYTTASGWASFSGGFHTKAYSFASCVIGSYNASSGVDSAGWTWTDPIFVIGNGPDAASKSNAMTVLKNGNVGIGPTSPSTQLHTTGGVRFQTLTGTDTRFVLTDANGNLLPGSSTSAGIVTGSGTLNYIPKWTPNGATLGNSQIFDNATNVGIGTASPGAKIDVNGSYYLQRPSALVDGGNTLGGAVIFANTDFANGANGYMRLSYPNTTTVLFGTDYDGNLTGSIYRDIQFGRSNNPYLTIKDGGNVGIGTSSPANLLDINTTSNTSGISLDGRVSLSSYSGDTWLRLNQNSSWTSGVYTPGFFRADGGIASGGIGTPGAGNIGFSGTHISASTAAFVFDGASQTGSTFYWRGTNGYANTTYSEYMQLNYSGTPGQMYGDVYAFTYNVWDDFYYYDIINDLDAIDNMRPTVKINDKTKEYNLVTDPKTLPEFLYKKTQDGTGYYYDIHKNGAFAIGAVRQLRQETKTSDDALEAKIDRLEKIVEQLTGEKLGYITFEQKATAYKDVSAFAVIDARINKESVISITGIENYTITDQKDGSFMIRFATPPIRNIEFSYFSSF